MALAGHPWHTSTAAAKRGRRTRVFGANKGATLCLGAARVHQLVIRQHRAAGLARRDARHQVKLHGIRAAPRAGALHRGRCRAAAAAAGGRAERPPVAAGALFDN